MRVFPPSTRFPFVLLALVAGALTACSEQATQGPPTGPDGGTSAATGVTASGEAAAAKGIQAREFAAAIRAQERHSERLLARPGVVGTAVGLDDEGRVSVKVYVLTPEAARGIPARLDDTPVAAVVTGMFRARSDETSKRRPAPIGFSVGHPDITAGTLGARVFDGSASLFILSNNHVLANSNDANLGDPTLQPGPSDGGSSPADSLGALSDFQPIAFDGSVNHIDAAISSTVSDNVDYRTPSDEGYGAPGSTIVDLDGDGDPSTVSQIQADLIGAAVQKYGRTTGHTLGQVEDVNVAVNVCYECAGPFCFNCKKLAYFEDQITITPGDFSGGGDSGSLIVTDDDGANPVGLLFAGGPDRTIANRIDRVVNRFGVTVDDGSGGSGGGTTNSAPTASFTSSCADLACDFDGSGSSDSDGSISSYDWDFGDGTTGSGVSVSHTYEGEGTYTVTLTVTDDDGATDSSSQDVTVSSSSGGGGDAGGIHVGDLDGSSTNQGSTWTATVVVTVHDIDHTGEGGSSVAFDYSGRDVSGSESCTTDSSGTCSISVSGIRKRTGSVTFVVTAVSDTDGSYSSSDNHDPDGDSDGTSIAVSKP